MSDSPPPPRLEQPPPPRQQPPMVSPQRPPPQKRGFTRRAKPMICHVMMLDGETLEAPVSKKALGSVLFELVCDHQDVLERSYFGLTYKDDLDPSSTRYWLDVNKTIAHQKRRGKWEFEFAVKFYPPDPSVLKESRTRYLIVLQLRNDIASGRLPCTFATQAVLGSFCVQADLGDYEEGEHGNDLDYIRGIPFAPLEDQTPQLLEKIAELHRDRKGMLPEQAELQYLEYAKKIALYGIHLHAAKDSDFVDIKIGIGASGISVYRENLRINRFVWPKVLKISYRRNKFLIRIRPGEFEEYESWIAFKLPTNRLAKRLWKLAIEHHAFLRLREAVEAKRGILPRFGSKYRFSGRTLWETRTMTEDRHLSFERTGSKQYLNNNRTRSIDDLPFKQRSPGYDPNLSTTSAEESFDTYNLDSPAERAAVSSRIIRQEIREEDEEEEREPRAIRPSQNGPRVEEKTLPPTEIKIEHKFVRRVDPRDSREANPPESYREDPRESQRRDPRDARREKEEELTSRLPDPPSEEPRPAHQADRRGVATPLAAVGLPPSVKRYDDSDHSPRGSLDSEDLADPAPPIKHKPPTAPKPAVKPKPDVKKKPTIIREMDL